MHDMATTHAAESRVARLSYRVAQLGAALHVIGGSLDVSMRELQPFHLEYLQATAVGPSPQVTALLLALFHALGAALIVGGVGMLALLHVLRQHRTRWIAIVVVALACGCEGMVGLQMLGLGLSFGAIPLAIGAVTALATMAYGLLMQRN